MGQLLDIVPNHMGVMGADNQWWLDVLENGPASAYAGFFDIDWQPVKESLHGKVLVPVLGDQYGTRARARRAQAGIRCASAASSACGITSIAFRSIRASITRILGVGIERLECAFGRRARSCAGSSAA